MIMPKKELKSENSAGTALQEMESLSPGGDLQAYINSVHSIGILTSEEEKKNNLKDFEQTDIFNNIKKSFPDAELIDVKDNKDD